MVTRLLEPELLDSMLPEDPRAVRARRDLRRVNRLMGHTGIWKKILSELFSEHPHPLRLVELGTGDGSLLLRLARVLPDQWRNSSVELIDRHPAVSDKTIKDYENLGWKVSVVNMDIMDWIRSMENVDLIMTNLVLHHFSDTQISEIFHYCVNKSVAFTACEPRRSTFPLIGSHLLGLVGCSSVTRYDAVVSVRAGFSDAEISSLWPDHHHWKLHEASAGLFSHIFIATPKMISEPIS